MNTVNDKVVVILGASSGIGEATVRLLADKGAKLVIASRVLNESPRLKGNTKQMVDSFRDGAESAGHKVDCQPRNLKKAAMILSSGDPAMCDGAMFSYKEDLLEYLGLEDMGVFTAYGMENGSASKLKELRDFGKNLK